MSDFQLNIENMPDPGYESVDYEVDYSVVNEDTDTTSQNINLYVGPLPATISEDFGRFNALGEYSGNTGSFDIDTNVDAQTGNGMTGNTSFTQIATTEHGVWEPEVNIRMRCRVGDGGDDQMAFLFAIQDPDNLENYEYYSLGIEPFTDQFGLRKGAFNSADGEHVAMAGHDFTTGSVYEVVMESFDLGRETNFDVTLYDITQGQEIFTASGTDSSFSHHNTGWVGWQGWLNDGAYFDLVEEVTSTYEPNLKVLNDVQLFIDGNTSTTEIDFNETLPYTVRAYYDNASTQTVNDNASISASNSSYVTIDTSNHEITGDSEGSTDITASYGGMQSTVPVNVVPPIAMIDNFESYGTGTTDLMNTYSHGAVNDGEGNFEVVSNGLNGTSQSLSVSQGSTQTIEAHHDDGSNLENYINNGDTFRFAWEYDDFSSGNRAGVWYGLDYSGEPAGGVDYGAFYGGYVVWITSGSEQVRIREWTDFSATDVASVSLSGYSTGQTWECEVTWSGNSHDLSVYDNNGNLVGSDSGSDSAHDADGTIGYGIDDGDNSGVYIDEVRKP